MTWQRTPAKQPATNWDIQAQIVPEPECTDRSDSARRLLASLLVRRLASGLNGDQAAGGEVVGLDGGEAVKGGG